MSFYVFGLQRSGTNFFENILKNNFHVRQHNRKRGAWKHSVPLIPDHMIRPTAMVYVLHKNPYTWIESLCYRNAVDWVKTQDMFDYKSGEYCAGPNNINVELLALTYQEWADNWITNSPDYVDRIISYEDFIDPNGRNGILNRIAADFNKIVRPWEIPEFGEVDQSETMDATRLDYYTSQRPEHLTRKEIGVINASISDRTFNKLGYEKLDALDFPENDLPE